MKKCSKCNIEKELSKFIFRKDTGKHRNQCRICINNRCTEIRDLDTHNARSREFYKNNKDAVDARNMRNYRNNKDRHLKYGREWAARNPDKVRQKSVSRRTAIPKWLTDDQKEEISIIYKVCKFISDLEGVKYHVDHITPIKGENVSGLHVPWNLRVITEIENCSKGNKFE